MDEINGEHYFLVYMEESGYVPHDRRFYVHLTSFKDEDDGEQVTALRSKLQTNNLSGNMTPILSFDDFVFLGGEEAKIYVPSTDKTTYIKETSNCILLGDYLYKHTSSVWYKANISNGLDVLQWEMVTTES